MTSAETSACYVGVQGERDTTRCTVTTIDDGLSFSVDHLAPYENLTFAVMFQPGTFPLPEISRDYTVLLVTIGATLFSLLLIIYLIIRYRSHISPHKRYYKNLTTPVQYLPPKNLTVAESAHVAFTVRGSDKAATLLELATSHHIEIRNEKKSWYIKIIKFSDLKSHQKTALRLITNCESPNDGQEYPVAKYAYSTVKTRAWNESYSQAIKSSTEKAGLMEQSKNSPIWAGLFAIGLFILWTFMLALADEPNGCIRVGKDTVSLILLDAVVILIANHCYNRDAARYLHRTHDGLDLVNYLKGLEEYIKLAETERLKFNQSTTGAPKNAKGTVSLYERLLPYACIFGAEKSWLSVLEQYYKDNPDFSPSWYYGMGYLSAHDLHSFDSKISSTYLASSVSSSSSGFGGSGGGGGSSGGGGGGGGGGGI